MPPSHLTLEQLQLIYDNIDDLVFLIDVGEDGEYRVASVNTAYLQRTGLQADEIVGRSIDTVLRDEQYAYVKSRYDEAVAGGRPWHYATRTTLRGEAIYLDTTLVPVYDSDGRCVHLIGLSRDVTRSKLEEKTVREEKQRAENYLQIAEAVIVALDMDGNIELLNRKGYSMLGYPEGSLIGRSWVDLCIDPAKRDLFRNGLRRMVETGEAHRNVNYVRTASGERLLISWANALIRDDAGRVTGLLASGEDITDRRRAEQAMIASQRVLAADEVVSAVAHDFNNSLQGILGNIEIAQAVAGDPQALADHLQTAAKLADDAARRLRTLRRATAANISEDHEALDLHELIDDVIAQTRPLWKDEVQRHGHDISVTRHFSPEVGPMTGNPGELRSVLYNIVKNAIEAIDGRGDIVLETHVDQGFNVVIVRDTGSGMDSATMTRVFQPFFSTKGMEAGRGLGMSAVHSLVRLHQGDVRVKDSQPGIGTTIELRLPTNSQAAKRNEPAAPVSEGRHRVLWVDDEAAIRTLAHSYLRALGCKGDIAASGPEALQLLARNDYSLVITDVGMPGMSGLELAEAIQTDPHRQVPVVALTGWGDTVKVGDRAPDGVLQVLAKPIRVDKLREVLAGLPPCP